MNHGLLANKLNSEQWVYTKENQVMHVKTYGWRLLDGMI